MCVAALTILGSVVSAAGSISQGNAAEAAGKAQADAYKQQAQAEQKAASFEASQTFRKSQLAQSAARAQVGASGVGSQGSPTEVLVANAGQSQLELDSIMFGSRIKQNNLKTQADISLFEGRRAKSAGFINAATGIFGTLSAPYDPNKSVSLGGNLFSSIIK